MKDTIIKLRVSKDEKELLYKKAREEHKSMSMFIRDAVINEKKKKKGGAH